jgi:hypothetical protein
MPAGNFPVVSSVRTDEPFVTSRSRMKASTRAAKAAAGVSWLALVAATTVGVGSLHRVRAAVSADARSLGSSDVGYRLVVQSYSPESFAVGPRDLPSQKARPLASTQRAVTREELARGVAVDVLGVSASAGTAPIIVAWVERGRPDLEFDALEARPSEDAVYGVAAGAESGPATPIVLKHRVG